MVQIHSTLVILKKFSTHAALFQSFTFGQMPIRVMLFVSNFKSVRLNVLMNLPHKRTSTGHEKYFCQIFTLYDTKTAVNFLQRTPQPSFEVDDELLCKAISFNSQKV